MTLESNRKQRSTEISFDVLVKPERIIKSSDKAFCILMDVQYTRSGDFDGTKSVEIWVPRSIVKDNHIPKWFIANKLEELMKYFHITTILEQGK